MTAFTSVVTDVVRTDDGTVTIGIVRPRSHTRPTIELAGASLTVDLDDLSRMPVVAVTDAAAASWWLAHVLGEDVAVAVLELAEQDGPALRTGIRVEPGEMATPILRLAVGLWLHRWWPSGRTGVEELGAERERWLETELGILAWYVDQALDGCAVAAELLEPNIDHILRFADRSPDRMRTIAALRAVIECVPLEQPVYEQFERLERAHAEALEQALAADESDWLARFHLQELEKIMSGGEPRRSHVESAAIRGTATVDWSLVPPRAVTGEEQNVRWEIGSSGSSGRSELTVSVPAGPRWANSGIHAALYRNDALIPELMFELVPDVGTPTLLAGSAPCEVETGDRLRVEVFGATWLEADETPMRDVNARGEVARYIGKFLRGAPDVDSDAAPYDLPPGEWPLPPLLATWRRTTENSE